MEQANLQTRGGLASVQVLPVAWILTLTCFCHAACAVGTMAPNFGMTACIQCVPSASSDKNAVNCICDTGMTHRFWVEAHVIVITGTYPRLPLTAEEVLARERLLTPEQRYFMPWLCDVCPEFGLATTC